MSDVLRSRLHIVRTRTMHVDVLDGICRVVLLLVAGLGLMMSLDWLVELPLYLRAILLITELSAIGVLVARHVVRPITSAADEDDLSFRVQQHSPALGSRLIAAVQLTRSNGMQHGTSRAMLRELVRQTETLTQSIDFRAVVDVTKLKRTASIAAFSVLVGGVALAAAGADGRDLLERAFLIPGVDVPRRTRVELLTQNPTIIGRGDSIELRARAAGVIPHDGTVDVLYDGDQDAATLAMNADAEHPKEFTVMLASAAQSFTYRVRLNDGRSVDGRVRVSVRPAVVKLQLTQTFPPYTHLPAAPRLPDDLQLLAGSGLSIRVSASSVLHAASADAHTASRVVFRCKSGNVELPFAPIGTDGKQLTTPSPLAVPVDATGMSVVLVDVDGLQSADAVVHPITILPDRPPTVGVTFPEQKEQLSTALATLIVGVEARDDFALARVRLRYRVNPPDVTAGQTAAGTDASPDAASNGIEFKLPGTPMELKGRFPFDLATLMPRPAVGGSVEWWLEAEDTNDVTGPGKAASDHYLTRIASEAEVRAELYNQLSEHMAALKQTADVEKKDNADLGALIQQQADTP